ncbi:MAG: hypothetical protein QOH21_1150 [Acidobacteriota bacterium]|jgi:hypothetical protein|nr:hypothetical protein [Acidobacteriota bacterium]
MAFTMTANNRWSTPLLLATALVFAPLAAEATISRAVAFDEKVDKAAAIVMGTCVRQEARWDESHRWILTYSTFQIEKLLKGSMPLRELTIVTPGGEVAGLHQDTIGVPDFQKGDERVLFVKNTAAGPTVLFFDQGAYSLEKDDHGERIVKPVASDGMYVDTARGGSLVRSEGARTLREFEGAIRESTKRREAIQMEMIEKKQQEQASILSVVKRNGALVALALIGAVLATWQLLRRS